MSVHTSTVTTKGQTTVPEPIRVNVIEPSGTVAVPFDPSLFDYGRNKFDRKKLADLGFNGFRVHFAVNNPGYKDEVLVFQGASYFRALGKGQGYGLSARGLAVDTASATGEEFPRFVEFWVERPKPKATALVIYALLDSKRVAGAYRFVLTPGTETTMQVTARIFLRERIAKLGLAPLTSMFTFGENQPGHDDYRPEVHDSDGLSIQNADGEWIWRPLVNPKRLLVTSFALKDLRGFGLMQRDRSPASYEDPETLYERRPSSWVEPIGNWGAGRVELVQIPTPDETNDNIVAYWVADAAPKGKGPINFAYKLHWQMPGQVPPDKGWVVQTRRGHGYAKLAEGEINFIVDFDGGDEDYAVLNPTAFAEDLRWPPEAFVWLALELLKPGRFARVMLVGGHVNDPSLREMRRLIGPGLPGLIDLSGETNLAELGWLLKHARLLVSRNTGTTHLAAAVGCPTVELFGRLEPAYGAARWRSLGERVVAVSAQPGKRRLGESKRAFWRRGHASIPREAVLEAALRLADTRPESGADADT